MVRCLLRLSSLAVAPLRRQRRANHVSGACWLQRILRIRAKNAITRRLPEGGVAFAAAVIVVHVSGQLQRPKHVSAGLSSLDVPCCRDHGFVGHRLSVPCNLQAECRGLATWWIVQVSDDEKVELE